MLVNWTRSKFRLDRNWIKTEIREGQKRNDLHMRHVSTFSKFWNGSKNGLPCITFLIHLLGFCYKPFTTLVDQKRTVWYLILEIERTCKCKMCILSAEGFFEIELCQKTRISLIKLYDKYLPFCNFYALVSHAIFFSRKTHSQKSKKKCLKVGIVSSRSRWAHVSTVLKDSSNDFSAHDWDGGLASKK